MAKKLYVCIGCRQVHYDNNYRKEDGDFLLSTSGRFFESVEKAKKLMENEK